MRLLQVARLSKSYDGSTALDKQDLKTRAYAEASGHEIIGTASDNGVSGKTDPFKRPDLGRWLTQPALLASYDGVIASHLDRLGRSTLHWKRLLGWAKENGKAIITVDPQIDFSTPVGDLIGYVIAWLAEQELAMITERSKDTYQYLTSGNYLVGKPPYGFRVAESGKHKTLVPDPEQAGFIRTAVTWYLSGISLRDICAKLDERGAKPVHGDSWSPVSLSTVFRNQSLIGRRTDAQGRTILRHEPILDRPTWDKLQAELDRKANRKGVAPAGTHWLTGVVACAKCQGPMYLINKRRYFRCHGSDRQPSTCRNMIPVTELEDFVNHRLSSDPGYVIRTIVTPGEGHDAEIAEVEQDLKDLDWDRPDFLDRQARLLEERKRLRDLPSRPAEVIEEVAPYTVSDLWGKLLSAQQKRAYLMASEVRVLAVRGDLKLQGDPGYLATSGGWEDLMPNVPGREEVRTPLEGDDRP
jgi:DNA invertase Pin-like site-specific DNA recombinase